MAVGSGRPAYASLEAAAFPTPRLVARTSRRAKTRWNADTGEEPK